MTFTPEEMNDLTFANLISDNCVTWADVAEVDRANALEWFANNQQNNTHEKTV